MNIEEENESAEALKILIVNTMRAHDVDELIIWAAKNKYNLLFMTEFLFNEKKEKSAELIVKEDVDSLVAIRILTEGLKVEARYVSKQHIAIKTLEPRVMINLWYIKPRENDIAQVIVTDELIANLSKEARRTVHTGDLNARLVELGDTRSTTRGRRILQALEAGNYVIINEQGVPTFKHNASKNSEGGTSIIDWTLVTPDLLDKTEWKAIPSHFGSDHAMIELKISGKPVIDESTPHTRVSPAAFLKSIKKRTSTGEKDKWFEHYWGAVDEAKRVAAKRKLFQDDGLDHLRDRVGEISKKLRFAQGNTRELQEEATQIMKQIKQTKHEQEHSKWIEKVKNASDLEMYRQLVVKTSATTSCKYVEVGDARQDGLEAARMLVEKFYPDGTTSSYELPQELPPDDPPLTRYEVITALKSFKKNKAPGRSGVDFKLLNQWYLQNADYLYELFNGWFTEGIFPDQLKESMIKPLVKNKLKPSESSNIRAVALSECLARWYEKLLDKRLYYHAEKLKVLSSAQYGYREQRSAVDAANELMKHRVYAKKKKTELLIQVDVKAAFDSIAHAAVIKALVEAQIPGNLIKILQSYLTGRKATVVIAGSEASKEMMRGVPQGSCLGPHLYIITTDAILRAIERRVQENRAGATCVISFADDIVIDIASNLEKDRMVQLANNYLDLVAEELDKIGLSLSAEKTKLMWSSKHEDIETLKIMDMDVQTVATTKVLGINFTHDNEFEEHINSIEGRVNQWLAAQKKLLDARSGLSFDLRRRLITTVLTPKVKYGAAIWWPHLTRRSKTKLKAMARKAMCATVAGPREAGYTALAHLARSLPMDRQCELEAKVAQKMQEVNVESQRTTVQLGHPSVRKRRAYMATIRTAGQVESIEADVKYFTDGSQTCTEEATITGAAFVRFQPGVPPEAHMIKLGKNNTVFQAELKAIAAALENALTNHAGKSIAIFSDALSAIQAIVDPMNRKELARECADLVTRLEEMNTEVTLIHVKAHVGVQENELADAFAKRAALDGMQVEIPGSKSRLITQCMNEVRDELEEAIKKDPHGRTIKEFFDGLGDQKLKRATINAYTSKVYTGHGENLTSHLFGYKNQDVKCSCGATQTMVHLITSCPKLMESNVALANVAGIPPSEFFVEWERLRCHKNFHAYVALRAPKLERELRKLNQLEIDLNAVQIAIKLFHLTRPADPVAGPLDNWYRVTEDRPQRRDDGLSDEAGRFIYSDRGVVTREVDDRLGMESGGLIPSFRGEMPGDTVTHFER